MFTGLVEEVGTVTRLERRGESAHLAVRARKVLEGTVVGDSIAVNGACLTVVSLGGDGFVVDAMPETLSHTTLGKASAGTRVNLERSLALGGRLGGHLVLGHVDAVAAVVSVRPEGIAWRIAIALPEEIRACVAPKGSIAVDGISLTVIDVDDTSFSVGIIPHTLRETTLGSVRPGVEVNLEADVLARYVVRTVQSLTLRRDAGTPGAPAAQPGGLTEAFLREQGFI
jgi:riboflavin synthase